MRKSKKRNFYSELSYDAKRKTTMYRIAKENSGKETCYTVQKNRKWFIPWKWHDCKLEVFYGPGTVIYKACFATKEEAEDYIKHKGATVNALIPGYKFYQK